MMSRHKEWEWMNDIKYDLTKDEKRNVRLLVNRYMKIKRKRFFRKLFRIISNQ